MCNQCLIGSQTVIRPIDMKIMVQGTDGWYWHSMGSNPTTCMNFFIYLCHVQNVDIGCSWVRILPGPCFDNLDYYINKYWFANLNYMLNIPLILLFTNPSK